MFEHLYLFNLLTHLYNGSIFVSATTAMNSLKVGKHPVDLVDQILNKSLRI